MTVSYPLLRVTPPLFSFLVPKVPSSESEAYENCLDFGRPSEREREGFVAYADPSSLSVFPPLKLCIRARSLIRLFSILCSPNSSCPVSFFLSTSWPLKNSPFGLLGRGRPGYLFSTRSSPVQKPLGGYTHLASISSSAHDLDNAASLLL